jgi:hypothetical protein
MNFEFLEWFGNFINILIFAFISINIVNTSCFDTFQLSLTAFGLIVSLIIQIISIFVKRIGVS